MAILFFMLEKDIFIWYAVPYLQPKTEFFSKPGLPQAKIGAMYN